MMSAKVSDGNSYELNMDNRGFSLVELIICVAILAIAVAPLMKAFTLAANNNSKAQRLQNATSLAESIMEDVKSKSIDELITEYNGLDAGASGDPKPPLVHNTASTEQDFFGEFPPAVPTPAPVDPKTRAVLAKNETAGFVNDEKKGSVLTGGTADKPFYVLYIPGVTATQGQVYNATVSIKTSTYMGSTDLATAADVAAANSIKLPKIEEIDTLSQTVLTSRDFSKYDSAALNYFSQRRKDYSNPEGGTPSNAATITKKVININKSSSVVAGVNTVSVTCSVTYEDDTPTNPDVYTRDLFTGTYAQNGSDDLSSNIYLFYKRTEPIEVINVTDTSTVGTHRVYLAMQNDNLGNRITDITGTELHLVHGTESIDFTKDDYGDLDGGIVSDGSLELVTNLGEDKDTEGHIYREESSIRIYDITVELTRDEDNEVYATLTSTKQR